MRPRFSLRELGRTGASQYLLRFVFGGALGVIAWVVTEIYGPRLGGFFLAFPALLPASLTLVKRRSGRVAARDDARGAALGSLGLSAFGLTVATTAGLEQPALTLALALVVWLGVAVSLWWLLLRRSTPSAGHARCSPGGQPRPHVENQSQ